MEEWIHKYGKVFGIYKAEKPMMVISDVDMIKECFVKNANIFHDRPRVVINVEPIASSLLALQGKSNLLEEQTERLRTLRIIASLECS